MTRPTIGELLDRHGAQVGLERDRAVVAATASAKSAGSYGPSPTLRINWPFFSPAAAAGDPSSTSVTTTPADDGSRKLRPKVR